MKFVMGKTVLITGANSLLGTHTICELLSAGYAVRGLLRCLGSYVGVEDPALELVEGEFTDRETLRRAMHGCDYVVHCAAKTGQSGSYDSYEQVNVTATERLVELASECGVKRIVNVASANVSLMVPKDSRAMRRGPWPLRLPNLPMRGASSRRCNGWSIFGIRLKL